MLYRLYYCRNTIFEIWSSLNLWSTSLCSKLMHRLTSLVDDSLNCNHHTNVLIDLLIKFWLLHVASDSCLEWWHNLQDVAATICNLQHIVGWRFLASNDSALEMQLAGGNNMIRAQWSPKVCLIERRINWAFSAHQKPYWHYRLPIRVSKGITSCVSGGFFLEDRAGYGSKVYQDLSNFELLPLTIGHSGLHPRRL